VAKAAVRMSSRKQAAPKTRATDPAARPLVTFALFAYKQEPFIREAVEAALAQDYSPLEIILTDDCSPDGTFQIMEELVAAYDGPHAIVLNRNPANVGLTSSVNEVMRRARGELIVVAGGDDVSLPHRTRTMAEAWVRGGKRDCSLFSSFEVIDPLGSHLRWERFERQRWMEDSDQRVLGKVLIVGPTHCWSRALFNRYGDIGFEAVNEDTIIQFRASLQGGLDVVSESLVKYRLHPTNSSNLADGIDDPRTRELRVTRTSYDRFLKCLRNFQRDLATERSLQGESPKLAALERLVATRIRLWELRLGYLEGGRARRVKVVLECLQLGRAGLPEAARMSTQLLFPRIYRLARNQTGLLSAWRRLGLRDLR
jgi:glycosyltransferase involved in cell wall biosynthesis